MSRRDMLAKIHIAKKDLGLDDDLYRDALERVTGERSASKLSHSQLEAVLGEFRSRGWKPKRRKRSGKPEVRKVFALWGELREMGVATAPGPHGFVKRMTRSEEKPDGVEDPEFMDPQEARKVIEALKDWIVREGGAG